MARTYSTVPPAPQSTAHAAQPASESAQQPRLTPTTASNPAAYVPPRMAGATELARKIDSPVKDAAMVVGGVGLMAAGVPMLILPGPGVAAIAGGVALAGKGAKSLIARSKNDARAAASHPNYTRVP